MPGMYGLGVRFVEGYAEKTILDDFRRFSQIGFGNIKKVGRGEGRGEAAEGRGAGEL